MCLSQTLPANRSVDWKRAGLRDTTTIGFIQIDMQTIGIHNDGITPNDDLLDSLLTGVGSQGAILNFPSGDFLFRETVNLPSNLVIRGEGAESTTFHFDLDGSGHSFAIQGQNDNTSTSSIIDDAWKDNEFIKVDDPNLFAPGDWIRILLNDSSLVTSSWAYKTVGQVVQINAIENNKLFLGSPLRMDYNLAKTPYVVKMLPAENIGIECLKIQRIDNTAPAQTSNIYFEYAVNCWVKGIESENCTFSHIQARRSSNLHISSSYFHHGFEYGGNGRAYGVMLHITTNECRVEDNIFEHLRHSMIVQAGANGNVFAYNYSHSPFWDSTPSNSAGDAVLHGNYVYTNLFEQNVCQNIVIDNSHGPNGPFNTFFRNRAERYGIFFSSTNSPDQNFLGNEITNTSLPYSFVNYTIQGGGHFIHGNNNKGTIHPSGTDVLLDSSYAYAQQPEFVSNGQWAGIGTPNIMGTSFIPAYDRFHSGNLFSNSCSISMVNVDVEQETDQLILYPHPVQNDFMIDGIPGEFSIAVFSSAGELIFENSKLNTSNRIDCSELLSGIFVVKIQTQEGTSYRKLIKR